MRGGSAVSADRVSVRTIAAVGAAAQVAKEQGVSVAQVNECLNGTAERPGGEDELTIDAYDDQHKEGVLAATIPDKVLPITGGMPLPSLAALGLAAVGASALRAVLSRRS
jgi:hypothetical protein